MSTALLPHPISCSQSAVGIRHASSVAHVMSCAMTTQGNAKRPFTGSRQSGISHHFDTILFGDSAGDPKRRCKSDLELSKLFPKVEKKRPCLHGSDAQEIRRNQTPRKLCIIREERSMVASSEQKERLYHQQLNRFCYYMQFVSPTTSHRTTRFQH